MTRFSWTQPICYECWIDREGARKPERIVESLRQREVCVFCGVKTWSGIYYRVDPAKAKYPTKH